MPFLLLLLLSVILVGDKWPAPLWEDGPFSNYPWLVGFTWSGVLALILTAFFLALCIRLAIHSRPERREAILERYASMRLYHLMSLFVFYGVSLYVLGWGWTVQYLCTPAVAEGAEGPGEMLPGAELLILAPFLVSLIASWACFYDADKALHDRNPGSQGTFWSRRDYLSFHVRQNLALIIAPLGLMIAMKGLQRAVPEGIGYAIAAGLVVAVFIGLPWILRLVLNLKPLPDGPLRTRLLAAARRLNFRFSNILVWNTNGGVANAMVAGLLPYPRYILLTDRLISELPHDEIEAVFGHEVGHVKHAHMLFYVGFLVLSMSAVAWCCNLATDSVTLLKSLLADNESWGTYPFVGIVAAYVFLVFGFLSRRCERQADVFGCRVISCDRHDCQSHDAQARLLPGGRGLCPTGIRTFIEALEKVARLNGISRHKPGWLQSWQHSTIARRVEFLQHMLLDPGLEPRFQRTVGRVKWGLVIGLACAFVVLAVIQWWHELGQL
jgi:Zn-dependent protease with chaperone function